MAHRINDPLATCGDFDIVMELEYVTWPKPIHQWTATRQCFFPSLHPKFLALLFRIQLIRTTKKISGKLEHMGPIVKSKISCYLSTMFAGAVGPSVVIEVP